MLLHLVGFYFIAFAVFTTNPLFSFIYRRSLRFNWLFAFSFLYVLPFFFPAVLSFFLFSVLSFHRCVPYSTCFVERQSYDNFQTSGVDFISTTVGKTCRLAKHHTGMGFPPCTKETAFINLSHLSSRMMNHSFIHSFTDS